ncbi:hypothetical protein A0H81_14713 [Grifola frondosa]|uniref:Uncharacterized protein n=1 Tax=Grifola frondosa TaxID=5627 RepID=A0A1C7LKQ0_GRIFR|nr:hypothetical protein A0H81_14713 [Grifola frondosa]
MAKHYLYTHEQTRTRTRIRRLFADKQWERFLLPPMQPVSEHPIVDYSLKLGYTEELLRKLEVALLNKSKGEAVTA